MDHAYTAFRLAEWALEFVIVPPFCIAFLLAAISLGWAAIKQRPFKTRLWRKQYWLVLSHLIFFGAAIIIGVLWANPMANPTVRHRANPSAAVYLDVVAYCSLASCGFWVWRMRGIRWLAASLMTLAEVITWGAVFVAGMSITGDWL